MLSWDHDHSTSTGLETNKRPGITERDLIRGSIDMSLFSSPGWSSSFVVVVPVNHMIRSLEREFSEICTISRMCFHSAPGPFDKNPINWYRFPFCVRLPLLSIQIIYLMMFGRIATTDNPGEGINNGLLFFGYCGWLMCYLLSAFLGYVRI